MTAPPPPKRIRITRDGLLFVGGLAGIVYETLRHGAERPTLLLVFGAMIGLTQFIRKDEQQAIDESEGEQK